MYRLIKNGSEISYNSDFGMLKNLFIEYYRNINWDEDKSLFVEKVTLDDDGDEDETKMILGFDEDSIKYETRQAYIRIRGNIEDYNVIETSYSKESGISDFEAYKDGHDFGDNDSDSQISLWRVVDIYDQERVVEEFIDYTEREEELILKTIKSPSLVSEELEDEIIRDLVSEIEKKYEVKSFQYGHHVKPSNYMYVPVREKSTDLILGYVIIRVSDHKANPSNINTYVYEDAWNTNRQELIRVPVKLALAYLSIVIYDKDIKTDFYFGENDLKFSSQSIFKIDEHYDIVGEAMREVEDLIAKIYSAIDEQISQGKLDYNTFYTNDSDANEEDVEFLFDKMNYEGSYQNFIGQKMEQGGVITRSTNNKLLNFIFGIK